MTGKEGPVETHEGRAAENVGGGALSRAFKALALAGFALSFAFNLLRGRWLTAAFFLAVGVVFLKGREIDGWPKAARALVILVYAALAVGMFFQLISDLKGLR